MKKSWSYWERLAYPQEQDLLIIGAGFTGLSAAYHAKKRHPNWRILVLERDLLAEGASSKNAGFACYGTIGEILSDFKLMGREEALQLVLKRWRGLQFLRDLVEEEPIEFRQYGGTEVFLEDEREAYENALDELGRINTYFKEAGISQELYRPSEHYKRINGALGSIFSGEEAQLDPVKTLTELEKQVLEMGVPILRGIEAKGFEQRGSEWKLLSNKGDWISSKLLFCTNAFGMAGKALDITPARNQVLITKPFKHDLPYGNYHAREGYIYYRTVGERILIGGARHLAFEEETTAQMGHNPRLIAYLGKYLDEVLGMAGQWELDQKWSGIIATGASKEPISEEIAPGLWFCGRFGGMGVALSAQQGYELANRLEAD